MICLRAGWLGCPTLEKKWIMSVCCCGLRDASQREVGLVLTGVRSPDGDVWEEDMGGTEPGVGPPGSSRLQDAEADGGRRRYGVRALRTNRKLLDWISEAREFARASAHPPIVEPAIVVCPGFSTPAG